MTQTHDMQTLARLHAALDSAVEIDQLMADVPAADAARVSRLAVEAREILRVMLAQRRR